MSNLSIFILRALHKLYKTLISPLLGPHCRFHPSCSDYAIQALEMHGLLRGTLLSIRRILTCNSLFEGGYDPVPEMPPKNSAVSGPHN